MTTERTPDGHINNCAIACGHPESECQMCLGVCPDRAKFGMPNVDRVRPEIKALVARGGVTPAEIAYLRCNSWEWEALVPAMNNDTFVAHVEHALKNCSRTRSPSATYDDSIIGLLAPELLKRFEALMQLGRERLWDVERLETSKADLAGDLDERASESDRHEKKWREYERDYILPCFEWAKESGYDLEKMVSANPGHNCVKLLVNRLQADALAAKDFAATIDAVREALGQKETHYLVIADDVKELVEAVEVCESDGGCRAMVVLKKLRAEPGSGTPKSYHEAAAASVAARQAVAVGEILKINDPRFGSPEHMKARWDRSGIRGPFYIKDYQVLETNGGRLVTSCQSRAEADAVMDALDAYKPDGVLVTGTAGNYGKGIPRNIQYTALDLVRIAHAVWDVQHLLPHADDEPQWAKELREFHRAIQKLPSLMTTEKK